MSEETKLGLRVVTIGSPSTPARWVSAYDPDAYNGLGHFEVTTDPAAALQFATQKEAVEFWLQPSKVKPLREDGKPNRPLTAVTLGVEPLPEVVQ